MDLMQLKIEGLIKEESVANHYGVRVHFIGNLKLLSEPVRLAAERAMLATANNSMVVLSVCVAYTSTNEIVHAVQKSCEQKWEEISILDASGSGYGLTEVVLSEKDERENLINLIVIEKHMYMTVAPDPHILIRTSGETKLEQFSSLADSILFPVFALRALARNWIWAFPLGNLELPAESLLFGEKKETVVNIVDSHILGL